ncbi:MAG TPA: hypothetical protein VJ650_14210 [Gemmatimonadaceae bacterium]|nr:hypothetical protein [Gemmatimonadaceae bacterium]
MLTRWISDNRRGFALATAVGAIALVGALVAGAFVASTTEFRTGRDAIQQTRAFEAAEYGNSAIRANWNNAWNTSMNRGDTLIRTYDAGGAAATVRVTRLNDNIFLVSSEASAGTGLASGARRRVASLLKLNIPTVQINGALTARGHTKVGGSATMQGRDTLLPGWDCPIPAPGSGVPGLAIPDWSHVSLGGTCKQYLCVQGTPQQAVIGPQMSDTNTYFSYGDYQWNDLVAMANKILGPGPHTGVGPRYASGACDTANPLNWGEPHKVVIGSPGPCENYFPIIYAPGDLKINGDRGQGILLVNGALEVTGGFQFYGLIIVRGELRTAGTGGHFNGTVLAANVAVGGELTSNNTVSGNATFRYSSCAMMSALRGTATPIAIRDRAWVELY